LLEFFTLKGGPAGEVLISKHSDRGRRTAVEVPTIRAWVLCETAIAELAGQIPNQTFQASRPPSQARAAQALFYGSLFPTGPHAMAAGAGAFKAMLACLIGEFVLILASIERDVEPSNSQAPSHQELYPAAVGGLVHICDLTRCRLALRPPLMFRCITLQRNFLSVVVGPVGY
jgi:hypothetical protein